ncbi:MAG: response regulator [Deltaproteobacteria bacterium]|nr:response regulator [Deltaproteobacteria bacterium]
MRLLVIDDSKATRSSIKRILSTEDVVDFECAEDALEHLKRDVRFDVVLVDWHMPNMSGIDFIREVRKHAEYDEIRLVMVTSENSALSVVRALQAGADEYITKPFTRDGLLEKIEMLGFAE